MDNKAITRIVFTGDIAFSQFFSDRWRDRFLSEEIEKYLQNADIAVGNIECPLTHDKPGANRTLMHTSNPAVGGVLYKHNIRLWNMANNHIMDCGDKGLKDSLQCAAENNCKTVGVGIDINQAAKPVIIGQDVKVAFISVAHPWKYIMADVSTPGALTWDKTNYLRESISTARASADWVVLIVHGGDEYCDIALPYLRTQYRKLLDCGADIIVGHHPHVVQNYERVGEKAIYYSLGNFIFDTENQRCFDHTDSGVLLQVNFCKTEFNTHYLPIKIDRDNGMVEVGKTPPVFQAFSESQYKTVWPIEAKYFYKENYKRRMRLSSFMRNSPKLLIVAHEIYLCREKPIRNVHWGRFLNLTKTLEKKCPEEVLAYITNDLLQNI